MEEHNTHSGHSHAHHAGCGHTAINHADHIDYLHEGHLHRQHLDHIDECSIDTGGANPAACTPSHACGEHDEGHRHGSECGHEVVPHGDHKDFLVGDHLHHPHSGHCDTHGVVAAA
jgi:hypothetical protein